MPAYASMTTLRKLLINQYILLCAVVTKQCVKAAYAASAKLAKSRHEEKQNGVLLFCLFWLPLKFCLHENNANQNARQLLLSLS